MVLVRGLAEWLALGRRSRDAGVCASSCLPGQDPHISRSPPHPLSALQWLPLPLLVSASCRAWMAAVTLGLLHPPPASTPPAALQGGRTVAVAPRPCKRKSLSSQAWRWRRSGTSSPRVIPPSPRSLLRPPTAVHSRACATLCPLPRILFLPPLLASQVHSSTGGPRVSGRGGRGCRGAARVSFPP